MVETLIEIFIKQVNPQDQEPTVNYQGQIHHKLPDMGLELVKEMVFIQSKDIQAVIN